MVNEPTVCLRDTPTSGDTERGRAEGDDFKVAHVSQKKSVFVEVPFVPFGMANSMQVGLVASSSAHPGAFPAIVVGDLIVGAVDLLYAIAVYSPRRREALREPITPAHSGRQTGLVISSRICLTA